jgi:glycosyltransferase involved in cell wall biosynthesis
MAASLPVVATNVGGNAEAVEDDVSGRIVPPEDVGALAGAILELLSDSLRAREMGEAGRRRVEKKFTIDAMMDQVTRVYADLLRGTNDRDEGSTQNGKLQQSQLSNADQGNRK